MPGRRRPRLLVFNQYYWPGFEATAQLLTDLCEALAADYDVTVITGRLHAYEDEPDREGRNGVEIVRVHSTAYERAALHRRAANYLTYLAHALRRGLLADRPDIVLCMTDPPLVGNAALIVARRFGVPLIVSSQDVFPEIAVELKRLESPALVGLLRVLTRFYLSRADVVVAIGETMRTRLEVKGVRPDRLRVISNWVDTAAIQPEAKDDDWAREQGLDGRFVVMHSGNVGHAQDLDSLIRAATFLRDLENLRIVVIGSGARHADVVVLADRLEVDVQFLPYQPRERLAQSLSSADIHVVGLAAGLAGYVVPSRLYGILAVGRPVIVHADEDSEAAKIVRDNGVGLVVPPGRPELLAAAIRSAYEGRFDLGQMGASARTYAVAQASRNVAIGRYLGLIGAVAGAGRS